MKKNSFNSVYDTEVRLFKELEELRIEQIGRSEGCRFKPIGSSIGTYIEQDCQKLGRLIIKLSEYIDSFDVIHVYATRLERDELLEYQNAGLEG